jgi:hypothetical protein
MAPAAWTTSCAIPTVIRSTTNLRMWYLNWRHFSVRSKELVHMPPTYRKAHANLQMGARPEDGFGLGISRPS